MTHEELPYLAIIKDLNKLIRKQMKAIDAVVELHKPSFAVVDGVKGLEWCYQCADQRGYAKYPCPTIQAIEKELL
jgi:hypothetical protein